MHIFLRAACAIPFLFVMCAAHAADDALDEIVVTAELRERALATLPASATVLDARTIQSAGVQHFQDVVGLVPNLNLSSGTSRPRFFQLRGVGELEQWQGAPNPSVGFLIDGIDFSGIGMPAGLADVERIEVLRGPQGTAYGANALAGLIAINTRAPSREPAAEASVSTGDYDTYAATGTVGGPVGDGDAAWRLVAGHHRSNGFRRNSFLGRDDTNGYDESSARLKLRARPFTDVRADFTAMWVDQDNGYDAFTLDNSRVSRADRPGRDAQSTRAFAARLDFDGAADFEVVSRTSIGSSRNVYSFDGDWGNDAYWGVDAPYDYFQQFERERRTLSQDLRIVSRASVDDGAVVAWLAGVYALRTDEHVKQHDIWRDALFGEGERTLASDYQATNLAGYGEVEWRVGGATVLAAGARIERRDADYADTDGASFAPAETMYGGSLSLRHELAANTSVYARFARGYKAGGFNIGALVPDDRRSFDIETLHNFELGLRTQSADGALRGDLALFYMRRRDQQVPTGQQVVEGDPLSFVLYTDNAARGENFGLEATASVRPAAAWLLELRGAWLQTRYIGYRYGERDLDGREQAHAPQYQFNVAAEYRRPTGLFARVDLAGLDDFYFDSSHDERAPARVLTHLKAGYAGKNWRAEVWVRNLFDEYHAQRGFRFGLVPPDFAPTRYVQAGDPRHAGVTVAYTFR